MRRQALVVGIEGPAADPADDTPPPWQPLVFAVPNAQRVAEALEKEYSYVLLKPGNDPATTAAALGDALTQAVSSQADFTVIHLLAHGIPTRNGHGIQAMGGDGRLTEELARWVNMAENQDTDGSGDPAVLLILDLCHSGAVVTEHLRSLVRPERRRVWVLAACHSEQDAYDGRLSTAVDEVLRGFASGTLKLDTSVPYIPIARFCREVALHVESRSTALDPQSVEQPLAALGADLSYLRFFANPGYEPAGARRLAGVDPAVFTLLDEVADARHFVIRAHGADSAFGDLGAPSITGRSEEVELPHTNGERLSCYRYLDLGHGPEPVAGDRDGIVWIGDEFLELLNEDHPHADAVSDLAAVPLDGSRHLLSAGMDGVAQLYPLDGYGSARQVVSHTTAITRVAIVSEPHRTRILTASNGGTVRVSNAAGGEVPQRPPGTPMPSVI